MHLIQQALERREDHLVVFDTRYGRGIMAGLFYDIDYAAKVVGHFNGADDEGTSSDDWFLNGVYPACNADTTADALAKLEAFLAKLAALSPQDQDVHKALVIDILNGYRDASRPDRAYGAIEMPQDLAYRIDDFRRKLIDLKTFDLWLEGGEDAGQWTTAFYIGQVQGATFNDAVRYYVRTLPDADPTRAQWRYDLHGLGHHVGCWVWAGHRTFDNEADARRSFG